MLVVEENEGKRTTRELNPIGDENYIDNTHLFAVRGRRRIAQWDRSSKHKEIVEHVKKKTISWSAAKNIKTRLDINDSFLF